jgi:uncharacterized protein (TIGR03085 family)
MLRLAPTERASLCDLLLQLGPDEPTLCEGWRTRDLAAHLVLREGRLDAMPGIALKFWAPWTNRVQQGIAGGDFRRLVYRLRSGPPPWSPFRPARLDEAANGVEFFIHHEDVRRAQPGWQPREFARDVDDLLWQRACRMSKFALRRETGGVTLLRTETGERHFGRQAKPGEPMRQVAGSASEILMYLFDRRAHAKVEVA